MLTTLKLKENVWLLLRNLLGKLCSVEARIVLSNLFRIYLIVRTLSIVVKLDELYELFNFANIRAYFMLSLLEVLKALECLKVTVFVESAWQLLLNDSHEVIKCLSFH